MVHKGQFQRVQRHLILDRPGGWPVPGAGRPPSHKPPRVPSRVAFSLHSTPTPPSLPRSLPVLSPAPHPLPHKRWRQARRLGSRAADASGETRSAPTLAPRALAQLPVPAPQQLKTRRRGGGGRFQPRGVPSSSSSSAPPPALPPPPHVMRGEIRLLLSRQPRRGRTKARRIKGWLLRHLCWPPCC